MVETGAYLAAAKRAGMSTVEMVQAVNIVAADPRAGDLIVGSGGCRKVRVAGRGRGKSGGYRVVTFFGGEDLPVFLVAALSKASDANFTHAQVNAMDDVASRLVEGLGDAAR